MLNLSSVLELQRHELAAAFERGAVGDVDAIDMARRLYRQYRIDAGYSGAADLLTHPAAQLKLGKTDTYSVGLTLQSADGAGVETCPWRGDCASVCVLKNGNGRYASVQRARDVRTQFLRDHAPAAVTLLGAELRRVQDAHGTALVRLNVNSDLRWYRILPNLGNGDLLPGLFFYDYTKNPAVLSGSGMVADRYRLTYSVSENSDLDKVAAFVNSGGTATFVTNRRKGSPTIERWRGYRVVDGDVSDDRYHETGVVVDLAAKGKARQLIGRSVFVADWYRP
jgi:hypothetical protein